MPQAHDVADVRFTPFFITALIYAWTCGRCSAIVHDPSVHAGHHVSEDQITKEVRALMDARDEEAT